MYFGAVVHTRLGGGGSHHQVDNSGDLLLKLSSGEHIIRIRDVQALGENVISHKTLQKLDDLQLTATKADK